MTTYLKVADKFPDVELPNQDGKLKRLSHFTRPSQMDQKLDSHDGYPLIVVFYRGFFCPRDNQQMRQLVQFQAELKVNYGQLVSIGVQPPMVQAAFRAGLGAQWHFLSDEKREVIKQINILDETEGEYAYVAQPYTFVLRPDLTIYKIYNGWFYVGRPTLDELRLDLRAIMETLSNYRYEAYNTPEARRIRIPQQEWTDGPPPLGASGLPVAQGVVRLFDLNSGNGQIDWDGREVFFNFTAIPGQGYRTVFSGTVVQFEVVENETGLTARNIQVSKE
ncbi:MAG: redoxin domain-containing protein [Chloroflexi bacterium]|nr:redoxin domain-containing protein [Chloroflexota bacterium]